MRSFILVMTLAVVLAGCATGDHLDGGADKDLIFGDNVALDRVTGSDLNPRFRALQGTQIYSTTPGSAGNVPPHRVA